MGKKAREKERVEREGNGRAEGEGQGGIEREEEKGTLRNEQKKTENFSPSCRLKEELSCGI